MSNYPKCFMKAHSGTEGFAKCQLCLYQDVCETQYQESKEEKTT